MPSKPRTAAKAARQTEFKTWDQYVSEADIEPFPLALSAEETLLIACPDGADVRNLNLARQNGDEDLVLVSLFGEHAEKLKELSAGVPWQAMEKLVQDVCEHFNLVDAEGDSGE